ncbi:dihydrofolate reductase family protein [Bacteroidota bacterium]
MSKIILYIATSSDGFIAKKDHDLDWLKIAEQEGEDYGYNDFYNSIDALIMGRQTYEVVKGFGDWVYAGKPSFVLSRKKIEPIHSDIIITSKSPENLISDLKSKGYQNIWLVGGGKLATSMINSGLVDDMIISIIPVELKEGIPLMAEDIKENIKYEMISSKSYDTDVVQNYLKKVEE